jgi:hypothetical protein
LRRSRKTLAGERVTRGSLRSATADAETESAAAAQFRGARAANRRKADIARGYVRRNIQRWMFYKSAASSSAEEVSYTTLVLEITQPVFSTEGINSALMID